MNCPLCKQPMVSVRGTQLDAHKPEAERDGWTVYCPHRNCPADEISGHGSSVKDAEKIINQRKLKSDNEKD